VQFSVTKPLRKPLWDWFRKTKFDYSKEKLLRFGKCHPPALFAGESIPLSKKTEDLIFLI